MVFNAGSTLIKGNQSLEPLKFEVSIQTGVRGKALFGILTEKTPSVAVAAVEDAIAFKLESKTLTLTSSAGAKVSILITTPDKVIVSLLLHPINTEKPEIKIKEKYLKIFIIDPFSTRN